MNSFNESDQFHHCRNDNRKRPSSLTMEDGQLQISVSDGEVPTFIIDANAAVKDGKIVEAVEILTDDAIDSIRKLADKNEASTTVMIALAKLLFDTEQWAKAEEWYIHFYCSCPYSHQRQCCKKRNQCMLPLLDASFPANQIINYPKQAYQ